MVPTIQFSINRISAPRISFAAFAALSRGLAVSAIEVRNDLAGVEMAAAQMRDGHRVLVAAADRLDNAGQLVTLFKAGYTGFASFEPFAEEIAAATDIAQRLASSMAWQLSAVVAVEPGEAQPA
jgi:predicted xylose isomerase-like sugar epimerase